MPNDPLARYHFTDDHGHQLENCVEYRELLAENERLVLENQRLSVDGVNGEAYLLTCLDIIRKAVGMPVGSDWQQVAERVERLDKEADWLGLRLWGTGGVPPVEDFDVRADRIKMWRKAARKAVEEKNG